MNHCKIINGIKKKRKYKSNTNHDDHKISFQFGHENENGKLTCLTLNVKSESSGLWQSFRSRFICRWKERNTQLWRLGCALFAEILLARAHHQFFHKRCSFISHRLHTVESWNSCHVDKFVCAPLENVKISAKRAHPCINVKIFRPMLFEMQLIPLYWENLTQCHYISKADSKTALLKIHNWNYEIKDFCGSKKMRLCNWKMEAPIRMLFVGKNPTHKKMSDWKEF